MCSACQSKMNGLKRRKKAKKTMKRRRRIGGLSTKGLTNTLTGTILPVAAGIVAGYQVPNLVSKAHPEYGNYAAIALGLFLAGQKGMVGNLGIGLAAGGAAGVVIDLVPDLKVNGLGLLPPGVPSVRISGPSDMAYNTPEPVESIKVQ